LDVLRCLQPTFDAIKIQQVDVTHAGRVDRFGDHHHRLVQHLGVTDLRPHHFDDLAGSFVGQFGTDTRGGDDLAGRRVDVDRIEGGLDNFDELAVGGQEAGCQLAFLGAAEQGLHCLDVLLGGLASA
jgi:hypothetical protein